MWCPLHVLQSPDVQTSGDHSYSSGTILKTHDGGDYCIEIAAESALAVHRVRFTPLAV